MGRLNEWFIHRKDFITLLLTVVTSLVLLFSSSTDQVRTLRNWSLGGFGYLLNKLSVLYRYEDVYEENSWLRRQNANLMLDVSRLQESALENQRLRALLDFKNESQFDLVPAKVIGRGENSLVNAITLTAGQADSITRNMAVVTAQGLVGKVYSVSPNISTVQLLLDRNFRVGATVRRSRVMGVVKWTSGNDVVLSEIPKRSDIAIGDTVITSGISTIFPGGLEIGKVVEISDDDRSLFMNVKLETAVDFSKLEEVLVVRKRPLQTN